MEKEKKKKGEEKTREEVTAFQQTKRKRSGAEHRRDVAVGRGEGLPDEGRRERARGSGRGLPKKDDGSGEAARRR